MACRSTPSTRNDVGGRSGAGWPHPGDLVAAATGQSRQATTARSVRTATTGEAFLSRMPILSETPPLPVGSSGWARFTILWSIWTRTGSRVRRAVAKARARTGRTRATDAGSTTSAARSVACSRGYHRTGHRLAGMRTGRGATSALACRAVDAQVPRTAIAGGDAAGSQGSPARSAGSREGGWFAYAAPG